MQFLVVPIRVCASSGFHIKDIGRINHEGTGHVSDLVVVHCYPHSISWCFKNNERLYIYIGYYFKSMSGNWRFFHSCTGWATHEMARWLAVFAVHWGV